MEADKIHNRNLQYNNSNNNNNNNNNNNDNDNDNDNDKDNDNDNDNDNDKDNDNNNNNNNNNIHKNNHDRNKTKQKRHLRDVSTIGATEGVCCSTPNAVIQIPMYERRRDLSFYRGIWDGQKWRLLSKAEKVPRLAVTGCSIGCLIINHLVSLTILYHFIHSFSFKKSHWLFNRDPYNGLL